IPLVFLVIFSSIFFGSKLYSSSTSAKTILAPTNSIQAAVAKNELATVMTSSRGPIPNTFRINMSASVPELTPIAYLGPWKSANLVSNSSTFGPNVNCPDLANFSICFNIGFGLANCFVKYAYSTFMVFVVYFNFFICIVFILKYLGLSSESGIFPAINASTKSLIASSTVFLGFQFSSLRIFAEDTLYDRKSFEGVTFISTFFFSLDSTIFFTNLAICMIDKLSKPALKIFPAILLSGYSKSFT